MKRFLITTLFALALTACHKDEPASGMHGGMQQPGGGGMMAPQNAMAPASTTTPSAMGAPQTNMGAPNTANAMGAPSGNMMAPAPGAMGH